MQVAVSAQGTTLDSPVDARFGRCQHFLVVDTETLEFSAISNPNIGASGGAGIQTAQMLAAKEIQAVLTGHCGPNAFRTLQAADIQVYVNCTGSVRDAVDAYKNGELTPAAQPNTASHAGMGGHRRGQRL